MSNKWGTRRGFIKLHIVVDSNTKKIYAVSLTDDKKGDGPELKKLIKEALQNIENSENVRRAENLVVGADGAYDSSDDFKECAENNVIPAIPIRKNFTGMASGIERKEQGFMQLGNCDMSRRDQRKFAGLTEKEKLENQERWKADVGYGRQWSAEIAFSTFKRVFGENVSSRLWCNITREIKLKIMLYNKMIDDAMEQQEREMMEVQN